MTTWGVSGATVGASPAARKSVRADGSRWPLGALVCVLSASPAWSQSSPGDGSGRPGPVQSSQGTFTLPPITVTGYAEAVEKSDLSNDPAANPASVTVLKLPEEKKRNNRDYVDLLKPIMGVAANNFDQGGIGFGFTMRGFSERSNGGGVAYTIDGVPVNLPSHALTNGYGDLTPLIPELLDVVVITRGPFDVRFGANALGGSAQFITQDRPAPGAVITGGNYDFGRAFAAYPAASGAVSGYASLLGGTTSGYRDNAYLDQINTFNKILFPMPRGTGSVRVQAFSDRFGAPGFVRRDMVENGTLSPRTAVNSTDGGKTDLGILAFNYKQDGDQPLTLNAYVMYSDLDRYSNRQSTIPTNPDLPGQNLQVDDRVTVGGTVEKYYRWNFANGMGADLFVGAGVRVDKVESKLFNSIRRVPGAQTEDTDFTLTNPYGYAQLGFKPIAWVKLTAGFRYDHLFFDIDDRARRLNVSPDIDVPQPKAGIVLSPIRGLDFFANYGKGFLPPSAIGGQLSRNPNLDASRLETKEIGVQFNSADGVWHVLADVYRTKLTNEIFNQPPPLIPIHLGPSRRDGFDLEARVRVYKAGSRTLSIFANYSEVDGELVGRATGTSIPDVAEYFVKYGFDLAWPLRSNEGSEVLTLSVAQTWEGPKPLNAANTLATRRFSRIDAKLAYTNQNWKGFGAYLGAIAYPGRVLEETAFTFGTPVTVGVSPKPRLTVQGGVFIPF